MTKAYYTDVRDLSDAELRTLSAEIEENFDVDGDPDSPLPMDDEAEARNWELQREIWRRYDLAHPEAAAQRQKLPSTTMLTTLAACKNLVNMMDRVNSIYDLEFSKIGQTLTVRTPQRFRHL